MIRDLGTTDYKEMTQLEVNFEVDSDVADPLWQDFE